MVSTDAGSMGVAYTDVDLVGVVCTRTGEVGLVGVAACRRGEDSLVL